MKQGMNTVKLRLPATSANLGPGFDAVALALELFLEIEARPDSQFAIQASGRNRNLCGALNRNLLIQTYESVLASERRPSVPLALTMKNGIPIGMGCGSSAAVRLAGVALASAFGELDWDAATIVDRATRLEGHPDNVTACWYGGMTIAVGGPALSVVTIPARGLAGAAGVAGEPGSHFQGARRIAGKLLSTGCGGECAECCAAGGCFCPGPG